MGLYIYLYSCIYISTAAPPWSKQLPPSRGGREGEGGGKKEGEKGKKEGEKKRTGREGGRRRRRDGHAVLLAGGCRDAGVPRRAPVQEDHVIY